MAPLRGPAASVTQVLPTSMPGPTALRAAAWTAHPSALLMLSAVPISPPLTCAPSPHPLAPPLPGCSLLLQQWPLVLTLLAGLLALKITVITALGPLFGLSKAESVRTGFLLSQVCACCARRVCAALWAWS